MDRLTLLIDTNVLMDVFLQRKPFEEMSNKVFEACFLKKYNGVIAAHSFTNMFYIMRKNYDPSDLRKTLLELTEYFEVSSVNKQKLINALGRSDFLDFEDCIQDECAVERGSDFIITRNTQDFINSKVPALTPEEFIKLKNL